MCDKLFSLCCSSQAKDASLGVSEAGAKETGRGVVLDAAPCVAAVDVKAASCSVAGDGVPAAGEEGCVVSVESAAVFWRSNGVGS